jgi:hypothetical protein
MNLMLNVWMHEKCYTVQMGEKPAVTPTQHLIMSSIQNQLACK